MLWSLLKVLVFVAIIAALTLGAGYLMEMGGGAVINMAGLEFTLSPLQIILGLVILLVALWVVLKLLSLLVAILKFINGDETAISRYFSKNRERKGYQALSEGMMALAPSTGWLTQAWLGTSRPSPLCSSLQNHHQTRAPSCLLTTLDNLCVHGFSKNSAKSLSHHR